MIKKIKSLLSNKKIRVFIILIGFLFLIIYFKFLKEKRVSPEVPIEISPTPTEFSYSPITPTFLPVEEKGDPDFSEEVERDLSKSSPLAPYLPYKTDTFSVGYSDSLTLIIILKKDSSEIRQEVLDWISDKGIDPESHKIIWKTP